MTNTILIELKKLSVERFLLRSSRLLSRDSATHLNFKLSLVVVAYMLGKFEVLWALIIPCESHKTQD